MNINYKLEDFITSLRAVTIPMLLLIMAMTIKVTALFYRDFEIPNTQFKLFASILLALCVALTLLTTSVNSYLLNGKNKFGFPELFAISSVIVMLLVFKVFEDNGKHWAWYFERIFLSTFLGSIEYMYSKLFVKKYNERRLNIDNTLRLEEVQANYEKVQNELQVTKKELNSVRHELFKVQNEFPCRHCGKVLKSISSRKKHEASCKSNPRNK